MYQDRRKPEPQQGVAVAAATGIASAKVRFRSGRRCSHRGGEPPESHRMREHAESPHVEVNIVVMACVSCRCAACGHVIHSDQDEHAGRRAGTSRTHQAQMIGYYPLHDVL